MLITIVMDSEHYWKLVRTEGDLKKTEKYIQENNFQLPLERLVSLSKNEVFPFGYIVWGIFFFGIPLLLGYIFHLIINMGKSHKKPFWSPISDEILLDPSTKTIICLSKFKSGWHPVNIYHDVSNLIEIDSYVYHHSGEGGDNETTFYRLHLNDEDTIQYTDAVKANEVKDTIEKLLA